MDDFGNLYQTDEWVFTNEQYAYSTATFGMLYDDNFLFTPYWRQVV